MSARKSITVSRAYNPAPDACLRALTALLKGSVNKKNAEPAPEPDVRNTRGESEYGSRATRILPD